MVLCLVPTAMAEESLPFTATVGETSLTEVSKTENAYTYHGWTGDETVDVYTVTIPATATETSLHLEAPSLAYNYMSDGNTWLSGYYDDTHAGVTEVTVPTDANGDGVLDYIQIQTPYVGYNSSVLYAITFCYEDGTTVKPVPGVQPAANANDTYSATESMALGMRANLTWGGNGNADDWYVMALARAGKTVPTAYYNSVAAALRGGKFNEAYPTDYARTVLALTAAGYDAANVGGYNLLNGLSDFDKVTSAGINAVIYALLAFDSKEYTIPEVPFGKTQATRENLVAYLLNNNHTDDGGWAYYLVGAYPVGEVDVTAMAIQALAPYYQSNSEVKTAVDGALVFLRGKQNQDGAFSNNEKQETAESTAQVIVALTALGLDPDIYFGTSAVDGLVKFSIATGGFRHLISGAKNDMASYQGYYALVAYYRFLAGKNALYDMTDAVPQTYPHYHPVPAASTVSSAQTADSGILLYAALSASALLGMGYVGKKRH